MLATVTRMNLTQVSTWFANARRRLKKENRLTWSTKNRSIPHKPHLPPPPPLAASSALHQIPSTGGVLWNDDSNITRSLSTQVHSLLWSQIMKDYRYHIIPNDMDSSPSSPKSMPRTTSTRTSSTKIWSLAALVDERSPPIKQSPDDISSNN